MTSGGFLSTAFVVVLLSCVAVLAVASALALVPFGKPPRRRRGVAFALCLLGAWAMAALVIALIRRTI